MTEKKHNYYILGNGDGTLEPGNHFLEVSKAAELLLRNKRESKVNQIVDSWMNNIKPTNKSCVPNKKVL